MQHLYIAKIFDLNHSNSSFSYLPYAELKWNIFRWAVFHLNETFVSKIKVYQQESSSSLTRTASG